MRRLLLLVSLILLGPLQFLAGCGTGGGGDSSTPSPPANNTGGGGGAGSQSGDQTYLFYTTQEKRDIYAVDPASPATPLLVEAGPILGISIITDASYDAPTRTLSHIHDRTVVYGKGGSLYKASALKDSGPPTPVRLSSETHANVICGVLYAKDFSNHGDSHYLYQLPGPDALCGTASDSNGQDNVWMMVRLGMGASDDPIPATEPVAVVRDPGTGALVGVLAVANHVLNRYDSSFKNPVPVTALTAGAEVMFSTVDRLFLIIDHMLRAYDLATQALSAPLHTFTATSGFSSPVADGTSLYFADGLSLYQIRLDGTADAALLLTEQGPGQFDQIELSDNAIVYVFSSTAVAPTVSTLKVARKNGIPIIDLGQVALSSAFLFAAGTHVYFNTADSTGLPTAHAVSGDGTPETSHPRSFWLGAVFHSTVVVGVTDRPAQLLLVDSSNAPPTNLLTFDAATHQLLANLGTIPADIVSMFFSFSLNDLLIRSQSQTTSGVQTDVFYANTGMAASFRRVTNTSALNEVPIH